MAVDRVANTHDLADNLLLSEPQGFIKVIIEAETNEILAAVTLGIGGDAIIHLFLDLMYAKAAYTIIKNAVHIHPTVCELIPTMLSDLEQLR